MLFRAVLQHLKLSTPVCKQFSRSALRPISNASQGTARPGKASLTPRQLADLEFETWLASNLPPDLSVPKKQEAPKVPVLADPSGLGRPKSRQRFSWDETAHVLQECLQQCHLAWKPDRTGFWGTVKETGAIACEVLLPRILAPDKDKGGQWRVGDPAAFIASLTPEEDNPKGRVRCGMQLIACLSHESAALGLWRKGQLVRHKVFRGYTVRRTQGKAQLTYIQQGGGSKSKGGAIRAREAVRLFYKIALRLREWKSDIAACNQAYASGTVRVWNAIYGTRKPPPIPRDDPRWRRLGVGVRLPRLKDLEGAFNTISHGSVAYYLQDHRLSGLLPPAVGSTVAADDVATEDERCLDAGVQEGMQEACAQQHIPGQELTEQGHIQQSGPATTISQCHSPGAE